MEELRIVKVIHQEDAPEEAERWMRRLIVKLLTEEIKANPIDIGNFLKEIERKDDFHPRCDRR